jgi:hypothetical protein
MITGNFLLIVHRQLVRIDNDKQDAIKTTTNTRLKE